MGTSERQRKTARECNSNIVRVVKLAFSVPFVDIDFFFAPLIDIESPKNLRVTLRNSTLLLIACARHNPSFYAFHLLKALSNRVIMAENNQPLKSKIAASIDQAVDLFDVGKNAECEAATRAVLKRDVSIWQKIYCLALLADCVDDWYDAEVSSHRLFQCQRSGPIPVLMPAR
jgi:hypothetical protein